MTDLSSKTVLVFDGGYFPELALRLSRGFGRVLYQCSVSNTKPKINEAVIGDLSPVERIEDFWPIKNEINLFVFPDCAHAGLQAELISQGFLVWGSRGGMDLELKRIAFKDVLKKQGLAVGPYKVCMGLEVLRHYLEARSDLYVKLSKFRGNTETRHWIDYRNSSHILDEFAITFGPTANDIPFLVEDAIETEIEWGLDTYFAGGQFPSIVAHGPEIKDKCYAGSVVKWDDLPSQVREVAEAMKPVLAESGYANFVSMEIRIGKDGTPYFTDPTCRMPMPAGMPQLELYDNLPEIIWAGAQGECIDPVCSKQFAAECIIDHTESQTEWRRIVIPKEVRRWVKLSEAFEVDGDLYAIPPFHNSEPCIGSIMGLGDTMEEAIEALKEHVSAMKDQPIIVPVEKLVCALKEIHEAEEQGMEFSSTPIPEPETVVSES